MNYYAYTPIPTDPVILNLDGCRDWGTLHQRIRKAFGFPDYYGETGCHVGLPDGRVLAAGAETHRCGRLCFYAPRAAGVCRTDAGDFQRPSGEISLGIDHIPLIADTTKPVGNHKARTLREILKSSLCCVRNPLRHMDFQALRPQKSLLSMRRTGFSMRLFTNNSKPST